MNMNMNMDMNMDMNMNMNVNIYTTDTGAARQCLVNLWPFGLRALMREIAGGALQRTSFVCVASRIESQRTSGQKLNACLSVGHRQ